MLAPVEPPGKEYFWIYVYMFIAGNYRRSRGGIDITGGYECCSSAMECLENGDRPYLVVERARGQCTEECNQQDLFTAQ